MSTAQLTPHSGGTPLGRLSIVENILRNRRDFFAEIRDGIELAEKIASMLVASLIIQTLGALLGL